MLLIKMFPAVMWMIAVYTMISGLSEAIPMLGLFAAGSVVIMVQVIILYQFLQRYTVGGSTAGAVKG